MTTKFLYHFDDDIEDASDSFAVLTKKTSAYPTPATGKFNQGITGFKDDTALTMNSAASLFDPNTSQYTIEFFMKIGGGGGSPQNQKLFWFGFQGFASHLGLTYNRTGTTLTLDALATQTTSATINFADGNFHHVAVVVNGSTDIKVFVDGVLAITKVTGQNMDAPFGFGAQFMLGAHPTTAGQYFVGTLDELRFVAGAPFYTTTFTPPTAAFQPAGTPAGRTLKALYHFDTSPSSPTYYLTEFSKGNNNNFYFVGPQVELTYEDNTLDPSFGKAITGFSKAAYLQTQTAPFATLQNVVTDFTFQWTMRIDTSSINFNMIFALGESLKVGYSIPDGTFIISMAGQQVLAPSLADVMDGNYHRIALVRSGLKLRLYVGGGLLVDGEIDLDENAYLSQYDLLTIGNSEVLAENTSFFVGAIDEFRFIDSAITAGTSYEETLSPFTIPEPTVATRRLLHLDGDLYDVVGGSPISTPSTETPVFVAGKFGSAYQCGVDGQGASKLLNLSAPLLAKHNFTIETFFKLNVTADPIQFLLSSGLQMYVIYQSGGNNFTLQVQGSGSVNIDATPYNDGQFHHIAVVRTDRSTLSIFIDGSLLDSIILANTVFDGSNVIIGGIDDEAYINYSWRGLIDEVRLSDGARYTSNFSVPTEALDLPETLAVYHFNDKLTDATTVYPAFVSTDTPMTFVAGKYANAVSGFADNKNLIIDSPQFMNFGREAFTIELYVKFERPTESMEEVIFSYGNDLLLTWADNGEGSNTGTLFLKVVGCDTIGFYTPDSDVLFDGQYHHIIIARQGVMDLWFFVDGLLRGNVFPGTYGETEFLGDKILALGGPAEQNAGYTYFRGAIEELRVSKNVIYQNYVGDPLPEPNAEFLPPDPVETFPPSTPRNLALVAGDGQVTLTWDAPLTGNTPISYQAYRYGPGSTETIIELGTDVFLYVDTAVVNGTQYQYKLKAANADGESLLSNNVSNQKYATPTGAVVAPSNPTALTALPSSGNINLTWSPSSTGTAPITYSVMRGTSSGSYTLLTTTTSTTYLDTTAVAGVTYYYVISASNTAGNSSYSNESNLSLQPPGGQMVQKQFLIYNPLDPENYQNLKNDGVTLDIAGSLLVIKDGGVSTAKLADGAVTDAKLAAGINANKIGTGTVSNTEFGYLAGLSGNIQEKFDTITANAGAATFQKPVIRALASGDALPSGNLGDRYIVLDASAPAFSGIAGIADGAIIEYNGSAFIVAYQPADGTLAYNKEIYGFVQYSAASLIWRKQLANEFWQSGSILYVNGDQEIDQSPYGIEIFDNLQSITSPVQTQLDAKANKQLSNLAGPLSINADLLPDSMQTRSIGNLNGKSWSAVRANGFRAGSTSIALTNVNGTSGQNTVTVTAATVFTLSGNNAYFISSQVTGGKAVISSYTGTFPSYTLTLASPLLSNLVNASASYQIQLGLRSEDEANVAGSEAAVTGEVFIRSGNSTAGGATGDLILRTGTTTGIRGAVNLSGRVINMTGTEVINVANPTQNGSAVNLGYLNGLLGSYLKADGSVALTGALKPSITGTFNLGDQLKAFNEIYSQASYITHNDLIVGGMEASGGDFKVGSDQVLILEAGAGVIDVSNARILNVATPLNPLEAANKQYVDDALAGADFSDYLKKDGSVTMLANFNMGANKIVNLTDPTLAQDAATKNYVDVALAAIPSTDLTPYFKKDGSVDMAGNINFDIGEQWNVGSQAKPANAMYSTRMAFQLGGSGLVNDNAGTISADSSGLVFENPQNPDLPVRFMVPVDFTNHKIINVSAPVNDTDASNKKYVDDSIAAIPGVDLSDYLKHDGTVGLSGSFKPVNDTTVVDLGADDNRLRQIYAQQFRSAYAQNVATETVFDWNGISAFDPSLDLQIVHNAANVVIRTADQGVDTDSKNVIIKTGAVSGTGIRGTIIVDAGVMSLGGSTKLSDLLEPTAAQDAATKNYVDVALSNIDLTPYFKKDGSIALEDSLKFKDALGNNVAVLDLVTIPGVSGPAVREPSSGYEAVTSNTAWSVNGAGNLIVSWSGSIVYNQPGGSSLTSVLGTDGNTYFKGVLFDNVFGTNRFSLYREAVSASPDTYVPQFDVAPRVVSTSDAVDALQTKAQVAASIAALDLTAYLKHDGSVALTGSLKPDATTNDKIQPSLGEAGNAFAAVYADGFRSTGPSASVLLTTSTGSLVHTVDSVANIHVGSAISNAAFDGGLTYVAEIDVANNTITTDDEAIADVTSSQSTITNDFSARSFDETTLNSGEASLRSGNVTSARSGDTTVRTGNATSGVSGDLTLRTGNTSTGISGGIVMRSGDSSNGGDTGEVKIRSGNTTGLGVRGAVVLDGSYIDVSANQIKNLADPTDFQDAATKKYVDDAITGSNPDLSPYLKHDGSVAINGNLLTSVTGTYNLGSPSFGFSGIYADRFYVQGVGSMYGVGSDMVIDATGTNQGIVLKPNGTGSISASSAKIINLASPTNAQDATNKSYVDTKVADYLALAGGSMNGDIAMQGNKIIGLGAPTGANDAVRLVDLQNAQSGTDYQSNVDGVQVDATLVPALTTGKRYIITNASSLHASFGSIAGLENNDIVSYDGSAFVIALNVSDKPAGSLVLVGNRADDQQYEYKQSTGSWDIFYGFTANAAGIGLSLDGNVLNVNLGAGIAQLPTDEVGLDLYASGGLFLTEDGISDSTASGSQLAIKLDGSSLERSIDGLKVKDGGITQFHINSSSLGDGLTGGSGSALTLNLNSTNFEFVSSQLSLKDASITASKLDSNLNAKIDSAAISTFEGTSGEALPAGTTVYIKKSDNKFYKALADDITNCPDKLYIVKVAAASANQPIVVESTGVMSTLILAGVEVFDSTKALYLSNAEAGKLTHIIPTTGVLVPMGYATDTADEWTFVQGRKIIL